MQQSGLYFITAAIKECKQNSYFYLTLEIVGTQLPELFSQSNFLFLFFKEFSEYFILLIYQAHKNISTLI